MVPGSGTVTYQTPDVSSLFEMPEVAYFDEVWLAGGIQYARDDRPGGVLIVRPIVRDQRVGGLLHESPL